MISIPGTNVSIKHDILFVFKDSDMESMRADGILGLSPSLEFNNFLDYAYEAG